MTEQAGPGAAAAAEPWRPLPIAARTLFAVSGLIGSALFGAFVAGVVIVFSLSQEWRIYWSVCMTLWVAWAAFGYWRGKLRWKHTSWLLDDSGLRIRAGWLVRSETLVPRSRVQHLDISRGPIERRFALATLIVHTAGSSHSAVSLGGLADADAVALRDALLPPPELDSDVL